MNFSHDTELTLRAAGALVNSNRVHDADDLADQSTFRLFPDGTGDGVGPSGERHARFRAWKQDLLGRSDET